MSVVVLEKINDARLIETIEVLLDYAEELKSQWQWKKDELGSFSDDYNLLVLDIDKGTVLLEELILQDMLDADEKKLPLLPGERRPQKIKENTMQVIELIEKLQTLPPEARVKVWNSYYDCETYDVHVSVDTNGEVFISELDTKL
jgi:hypothetical protein